MEAHQILERLVEESGRRGRVELERETALEKMKEALNALLRETGLRGIAEQSADELHRENAKLRCEIAECGQRELAALTALRELSVAATKYVNNPKGRKSASSVVLLSSALANADTVFKSTRPF